ncbi:MAG: 3-oxoacyl-ACP reductase [Candidatus Marinimicrobia bacterium]|nr:3-oxoacyl-ACP reductase [Candidatus Neomarinimicrobiota bacterium]|tara:strand:+ start:1312 stop:2064 length:753 start_codon:yes stop_codon:yes gene_type:complete
MKINLDGKVAIITGSSRGIGKSISTTLAQAGSNIIINGVSNPKTLQEQAEKLSDEFKITALPYLGDIADPKNADELVKLCFKNFKRLDILINNAGVLKDSLIGMIKEEDIDSTLSVNLKSIIYMTQSASRLMSRSGGGSIINISSIIGRFGNKGQIVYGASKAGVIGATLSASKELSPMNIRVNAIAPGYINTDMIKDIPPEIHQERLDSIGMKKIGEPEDIAKAALFLSSDLSDYITGQVLGVDGGMII